MFHPGWVSSVHHAAFAPSLSLAEDGRTRSAVFGLLIRGNHVDAHVPVDTRGRRGTDRCVVGQDGGLSTQRCTGRIFLDLWAGVVDGTRPDLGGPGRLVAEGKTPPGLRTPRLHAGSLSRTRRLGRSVVMDAEPRPGTTHRHITLQSILHPLPLRRRPGRLGHPRYPRFHARVRAVRRGAHRRDAHGEKGFRGLRAGPAPGPRATSRGLEDSEGRFIDGDDERQAGDDGVFVLTRKCVDKE